MIAINGALTQTHYGSPWNWPGLQFTRENLLYSLSDPRLTTEAFLDGILFQPPGSSIWIPGRGMPNLYVAPPFSNGTFSEAAEEVLEHVDDRIASWQAYYEECDKKMMQLSKNLHSDSQPTPSQKTIMDSLTEGMELKKHAQAFLRSTYEERHPTLSDSPTENVDLYKKQKLWEMSYALLSALQEVDTQKVTQPAEPYLQIIRTYIKLQILSCQTQRGTFDKENKKALIGGLERESVEVWRSSVSEIEKKRQELLARADFTLRSLQEEWGTKDRPARSAPRLSGVASSPPLVALQALALVVKPNGATPTGRAG